MTDILQAMLASGGVAARPFPPTSRYHAVELAESTLPDGRVVRHLRRRLVPAPERQAQIGEHVVAEGERLDLIAAQHLGDPELSWRLCDAQRELSPETLEQPGRVLRIAQPEGFPGTRHA